MGPEVRTEDAAYQQIAAHLRARIDSGEWQVGFELPSLAQIADDWSVSRITARKAMDVLRDAGVAVSLAGLNAVVVKPQTVPAPEQVAAALDLPAGTDVRMQVARDVVLFSRIPG